MFINCTAIEGTTKEPLLMAIYGFCHTEPTYLARSSLVSVLSRMLVWPYRPIHLLNAHVSGFGLLTPRKEWYVCRIENNLFNLK
jgi:hypothetical protein